MKFSIIVCAYNEEIVIKKCLESISLIDFSPDKFEIIVINNGSNDNTEIIVKEFFEKNQKINSQYLLINHGVLSTARNAGIYHSNFDYIVFIDADAIVDKNIVNAYQKTYEKSEIDFSGGKISLLNTDSSIARFFQKTRFKQIFELGRYKEQLIGANMSFKRKLFIEDGGFPDVLSRGDDTFIKNRFMGIYNYCPTPDAIVYHERPTNIIHCLKIFYVESINGEKIKKMISPPSYLNNIAIIIISLLFINLLINYPFLTVVLFALYSIKTLINSFLVVRYENNKNITIYSIGYSLLKFLERIIKTYVYYKEMFTQAPKYSRSLDNFSIRTSQINESH